MSCSLFMYCTEVVMPSLVPQHRIITKVYINRVLEIIFASKIWLSCWILYKWHSYYSYIYLKDHVMSLMTHVQLLKAASCCNVQPFNCSYHVLQSTALVSMCKKLIIIVNIFYCTMWMLNGNSFGKFAVLCAIVMLIDFYKFMMYSTVTTVVITVFPPR